MLPCLCSMLCNQTLIYIVQPFFLQYFLSAMGTSVRLWRFSVQDTLRRFLGYDTRRPRLYVAWVLEYFTSSILSSLLFVWWIYSLTGNGLVLGTEDGIQVIQGLTFGFFTRNVSVLPHNRHVVFECEDVYMLRVRLRATGKCRHEFNALHRFVFLQLVNQG